LRTVLLVPPVAASIGLAASLPALLLLPHPWRVHLPTGEADATAFLFARAPVLLALVAAGWAFGLLAGVRAGGAGWRAGPVGAAVFPVAAYYAARAPTGVLNWTVLPLAGAIAGWAGQPEAVWFSVAATFGAAAAGVALALTAAVGLAVRARGAHWRALLVAVATFVVYALVGAVLDLLPGWAMGRGHGVMTRVTAVSAFASGALGAALALGLLARGTSPAASAAPDRPVAS
jgi:hypothetical protein